MKILKKVLVTVLALCTVALCAFSAACEKDREGNMVFIGDWDSSRFYSGMVIPGMIICYEVADAIIEVKNTSPQGAVVFNQFQNVPNFDDYPQFINYGGFKYASPEVGSFEYVVKGDGKSGDKMNTKDNSYIYWAPKCGWDRWSNNIETDIEDYITFTVRVYGEITGYAVIYVKANNEKGEGKLIANKEISNMSDEEVKEKIQSIIEKHKK